MSRSLLNSRIHLKSASDSTQIKTPTTLKEHQTDHRTLTISTYLHIYLPLSRDGWIRLDPTVIIMNGGLGAVCCCGSRLYRREHIEFNAARGRVYAHTKGKLWGCHQSLGSPLLLEAAALTAALTAGPKTGHTMEKLQKFFHDLQG